MFVKLFYIILKSAFSFTLQEKNTKKICQICHLKGFFIMTIDLTGCPFYVLYHWTFNGNIFAIKYWKICLVRQIIWKIEWAGNTISQHFIQSVLCCMNSWGKVCLEFEYNFNQREEDELDKQICLTDFQCNWDDCICVLLLFLRINIY